MYFEKTPLRISLFGGSTDHPSFLRNFNKSLIISFASNLNTYVGFGIDKFGYNSIQKKYLINYSKREEATKKNISNELVKSFIEYFEIPPATFYLSSDVFSKGSGLASSSSYLVGLTKSYFKFKNRVINDLKVAKISLEIEKRFNKNCGYQDPYSCAIDGFKYLESKDGKNVKYQNLNNNIFKNYDFYLMPTEISRNSKLILNSIEKNYTKITPIFDIAKEALHHIKNNNFNKTLTLLNQSWIEKKKTSSKILSHTKLLKIDEMLNNEETVLSHKLLGAGGGGFFLIIVKKNSKIKSDVLKRIIKIKPNDFNQK